MNRCNEHTDKQLRDYFLDRLTSDEIGAFQFHLLHCEACRNRLERMREMATGWHDADLELPELPETTLGVNNSFRLFTRIAVVASLALLLFGGGYYFMSAPADTGFSIEVNEAPVFHSGDSVAIDDSTGVDSTSVQFENRDVRDDE